MRAGPLVQDLSECRDKALAGGKAVNLGILLRAGFPVPGGFVITTEAYRLARSDGSEKQQKELCPLFVAAWRAMGSPAVAVRSSATAEDMAEASMAGQYETFLDITTEAALLNAVQCCWASLDSPRTRSYLAEHGIDLNRVAMAVVVQRLVPAEVAGVLFTANPQTGSRREMLIEASWGLGEAVVSGRVQPDVLRLDRENGRVIHAALADKRLLIRPGEHEEKPVEESMRRVACLKSADVTRLWQLGRRTAEHFGTPQDLEWAIAGGELFLLQSRPVTTLEHAAAYEDLLQATRLHLRGLAKSGRGPWALHNIGETLKHPTPLTWSLIRRFMSGAGGFGAMYRQAGFVPSERVCKDGFLELIAGRAYMDVSLAPEMFFEGYPFKYDLAELRSNPDASQSPPTVPAGSMSARMNMARRVAAAGRQVRQMAGDFDRRLTGEIIPQFVQWCSEQKRIDLKQLSAEQWIETWRAREKRVMGEFAPQSLLPSMFAAMALAELRTVLAENFWEDDPDDLLKLLGSSSEPDKTLLANADLFEVAHGRKTVESWIADYGHRAPDEFDLATPRWRERPGELTAMAQRLKDGPSPMELHRQHQQKIERELAELRVWLSAADARELEAHLDLARRYLRFREDGKYYLMLGYELLRALALEAGRRLEIGEDVFQLSLDELIESVRVGFAPHHLIGQRQTRYSAESRIVLPQVIDEAAIETLGEPAKLQSGNSYPAFPLSTGTASGAARIVFRPEDAGELGSGYVLVCPSTDPGWTPLFVSAAAIVLECGGTLSHGAVVAREMNIPAVVLPDATKLLVEGEMIAVDGRNGRVSRVTDGQVAAAAGPPGPEETRVAHELIPPPPGSRERRGNRIRNITGLAWGVYLLAVWLLPERWVYRPSMDVLDAALWPLIRGTGKPLAVAIIAAGMALVIMVLQWLLTDNRRLREAKRRAAALNDEASKLALGTPRDLVLTRLASGVQGRILAASLVPMAVLLGPMVMIFLWLPARVDPAAWNAPPGTPVTIVAMVDSDLRTPIRLSVDPPLHVDGSSAIAQTLPPIRETLEKQLQHYQTPSDLSTQPWEVQEAANDARQAKLESLQAYLKQGVPPQAVNWTVHAVPNAAGRFAATVFTDTGAPVRVDVVLGDRYPPAPAEAEGEPRSPIKSVKIFYPKPERPRMFWQPLAAAGIHWEAGWMTMYLLAYLPMMFAVRRALRIV